MAIIRCPYCHAIIDENDKYCNNCGTQLLFPEDEAVEEEIPGEKIIDAETDDEEKNYDVDEPGKEAAHASVEPAGAEKETKDVTAEPATGPWGATEPPAVGELLEQEAAGDEGEEDLEADEDETEEVILVDEIAAEEAAAGKEEAPEEETRVYETAPAGKEEAAAGIVAPPAGPAAPETSAAEADEEPGAEPAEESPPEKTPDAEEVLTGEVRTGEIAYDEPGKQLSAPAGARPVTFDTRELEGIGQTVDLGKAHLDKLMEVMAEKQKEDETPAVEKPKAAPDKKTGTLPPWADKIRGSASSVGSEAEAEAGENAPGTGAEFEAGTDLSGSAGKPEDTVEEEIFPHRKASDSGIGFPERLTQAALPFESSAGEAEEGEEAEEEGEEEAPPPVPAPGPPPVRTAPQSREAPRPSLREETGAEAGPGERPDEEARPPFHLSLFLKARAFDILFVGVFWLVALWVAARSMGATLFELLSVTSASVLGLYAVFIVLYFFLFKFFLGETLGDRLFRERE